MLDRETRRAHIGDVEVSLARREFDVLAALMDTPGRVVSRERLFEEVWDGEIDIRSNAMEVHISRVRQHLRASSTTTISTLRGVGYRLDVSP